MLCKFKVGTAVKRQQERHYEHVEILGACGVQSLEIWKSKGEGGDEYCKEAEETLGKMGKYGAV